MFLPLSFTERKEPSMISKFRKEHAVGHQICTVTVPILCYMDFKLQFHDFCLTNCFMCMHLQSVKLVFAFNYVSVCIQLS